MSGDVLTPLLLTLKVAAFATLLAAIAGCGCGWWVGAAVENAAATAATHDAP